MTRTTEVPPGAFRRYEPPNIVLRVRGGGVQLSHDGVRLLEQARKTVLAERIEALRETTEDPASDARIAAEDILREIKDLDRFWFYRPFGGPYSVERAAEDAAAGEQVVVGREFAATLLAHARHHPELAAIVAAFHDTKESR